MSIKKFVAIDNVGKFHNARAAGDVEFKRLNLLYGENGRGKTTMCAILRSLQSGEVDHVVGRRTLGATLPTGVHILLNGTTPHTKFENGGWSALLPTLAIFDHVFISENVYTGDQVGTDQKRNLYKVIVGHEAVRRAQRLDTLVAEIRTLNALIRDANRAVEAHLQPGLTLKALLEATPDPEIDTRIEAAENEMRSVSEIETIRAHTGFTPITLPAAPGDISGLLAETLDSVSSTADHLIKAHIAKHSMRGTGQAWILQGLEYKPDEDCPFCGQDLKDMSLVDAYRVQFSQSYQDLKGKITSVGKEVGDKFGEQYILNLGRTLSSNRDAETFWRKHADFEEIDHRLAEHAIEIVVQYREALLKALRAKVASPLEWAAPDGELIAAAAAFEELKVKVADYNLALSHANSTFGRRKSELGAINTAQAKARLENTKTLKRRFEPQLQGLSEKAIKLARDKDAKEKERDQIKKELDQQSGETVAKYQLSINRYLDLFNAGFSIVEVDHNYVGGVNASYRLLINKVAVALGDGKTPLGQPSFKNTLSSGDRSTLALALFLAQLDHDPGQTGRIVVFDDPFNSQDRFRRNQTAIEIARLSNSVAQVVVLSHDARFLHDVSEKAVGVEKKTLKLNPIGEKTDICALDLPDMLREEVRVFIDMLQTYVTLNRGSPRDVVQKIRPLLEAYCRNSCITLFDPADILSDILSKIRTTGEAHPLYSIYGELNDLNDYTKRFHHGDGSVSGMIDETELSGYSKRALRVVGAM